MNLPLIQQIGEALVKMPDLQPITFCNKAVDRAASMMGFYEFHNSATNSALRANDIVKILREKCLRITPEEAVVSAKNNSLVVAAMENPEGHGHVAIVYPKDMETSGSWKKLVPFVANVGKTNGIMLASAAFPKEPEYYLVDI